MAINEFLNIPYMAGLKDEKTEPLSLQGLVFLCS